MARVLTSVGYCLLFIRVLSQSFRSPTIPGRFIAEARDVDNGDMFTIDGLSDKQLWRISRHKEFISTYSRLAKGDAGKSWSAYSDFIVGEIKKDASKFSKKRPIREYLDGNEEEYDFSK